MRIAYLLTRSDSMGGACVHVRDLAKSMQAIGHDVLVAIGGEGPFYQSLVRENVPVTSIKHLGRRIHPVRDLQASRDLLAAMRKFQPDLVCAHTAKAGFLGRYVAKVLGLPVILTAHGWSVTNKVGRRQGPVFRVLEKFAARFTDRIIDVSESDRRLALSYKIGKPEQHAVVHNGVADIEPELVASHSRTATPRITMIARFEIPKNHAMLLRALATLRGRTWTMDLIGDGPLIEESKRLAQQLALSPRVNFLGSREHPENDLSRSDIYVLCSDFEALPLTVLEAMRAGLPVIASDVGGISEAVENNVTGLLINSEAQLSHSLATLLDDQDLRKKMGLVGRKRYLQEFTLEYMLARTLKIYEDVLPARNSTQDTA